MVHLFRLARLARCLHLPQLVQLDPWVRKFRLGQLVPSVRLFPLVPSVRCLLHHLEVRLAR